MLFIKNGYIKTMAGPDIDGGSILVDNGKIVAIGKELTAPAGAEVIDAAGMFITPGLVDGHSHIGIGEDSVRFEGMDYNEMTDPVTPHMRGLDGIKPVDEGFVDAKTGGVTTAAIGPGSANVVGGTFSVLKLYGDRVDDMIIRQDMAMKCAFGENPKFCYGQKGKAPMTRMAVASLLRELLAKTREYDEAKKLAETDPTKKPKFDMKLEAMLPVIRKEIPLKAHAHQADDIMTAIRIAKEFDVLLTIEHCTDGHLVADHVGREKLGVFLGPTLGSKSKYELKNKTFDTPNALYKAGAKVCIIVDAPVIPQKYLALHAALAVKAGLPEQEGWKAITINPAEVIGVADRVGSLEVGKDADIVLFSGNPMKEIEATVLYTIIDGAVQYKK